jgi:hypothetical protein
MIKTGDFVRVKHCPEKEPFVAAVNSRGLIGGAAWWPDAWWDPKQVERICPTEDQPDDWCQFEWNPTLLP